GCRNTGRAAKQTPTPPNRPPRGPGDRLKPASRSRYGRSTTAEGEATGPPHGEAPAYHGSGSVMAPRAISDSWRPALTATGRSPIRSPGRSALSMRSPLGSTGLRSRPPSAEGVAARPTEAVPSPTRPPSGVVIHARTWASWPPSGGRSANAWTGSPSVVAYRKYSDRLPVSNQPWPNASSSSGGNWSMWMLPATVPPRNPRAVAGAASGVVPCTGGGGVGGLRTGAAMAVLSTGLAGHSRGPGEGRRRG